MAAGFEEYLNSKGGAGVLVALYNNNRTFSEILSEIDVTGTTLSKRLDEADDLGFISTSRTHRHGQRTKELELTDFGYEIAKILARNGVMANYRKMMTHKETMEEGIEDSIDEIYSSPGLFMEQEAELESPQEKYEDIREGIESDESDEGSEPESPTPDDSNDGDDQDETSTREDLDAWRGTMADADDNSDSDSPSSS